MKRVYAKEEFGARTASVRKEQVPEWETYPVGAG